MLIKIPAVLFFLFIFSNSVNSQVSFGIGGGLTWFKFDYSYNHTSEDMTLRYVDSGRYTNSKTFPQFVIPFTIRYVNNFGLETGLSFYKVGYESQGSLALYDLTTDSLLEYSYAENSDYFPIMSIPLLANYYFGSGKINYILSSGIETNINIFEGIDFSFAAGGLIKYNLNYIAFFVDAKYWMDLTPSFEFMDEFPDPLRKKGIISSAGILYSYRGMKRAGE